MDTSDVSAAVTRAYSEYLAAFHAQQAELMPPHVTSPLVVISDGRIGVLDSVDEVRAMFGGIIDRLSQLSYDHTVIDEQAVTELDERTALMCVTGTRMDRSGAALEPIYAVYNYVADGPTWRIAVMTTFTP